ncbi:TetR/AcrR family transcriptional regulator [Candidatus Stoquefichus massiliensis]|uniref:TetR/AcrR family transcriptional regulator n=1 Tax=Candidatus Stoquefichus massiliensis TaxID=1470350 RepID=UPI0004881935|nr:TetR/AcrR family transcriptional regulator [Candidatus Stoquefichus massiliensis]
MARNKHPEETLEKIIATATQLFMEKGYEQTSIQDILNTMNLSKGGLYHHFKSKEEILEAVMQKRTQYVIDRLYDLIQNTTAENTKEKLKKILYHLVTDTQTQAFDTVLSSHIHSHFVVNGIQTAVKKDAPIICELIKAGIKDGSLHTAQPELCSEVFLILLNYWANPVLFGRNAIETKERLVYLKFMMAQLGLDIIDDAFIDAIIESYRW